MSSPFTQSSNKEAQAMSRLIRRRKNRLNTYFREECEDRDVTGEEKISLLVRFNAFLEERFGEAETSGVEHEEGGVDAFVADRRAWEVFKDNYFPEPPLYMKIQIDSMVSSSTNNAHPIPIPVAFPPEPSHPQRTTLDIHRPKPVPVRKPGWKREPESLLLKGVLVSNAMGLAGGPQSKVRL
ncbi:hypothetical protein GYMLUDRAFT_40283 [Collybiopsis luxurians FD-317 M1]|uniref:Uncharacterized protein n=1 Tax=Collybiopsis luxurians FD-317 M1 TaxID=944289 RepID=A0A0D0C7C4_9AGAR|nr:hypothetical protein GYMLUDRAFT_40283 [Collybiopsis luxurians FD-317 M1]